MLGRWGVEASRRLKAYAPQRPYGRPPGRWNGRPSRRRDASTSGRHGPQALGCRGVSSGSILQAEPPRLLKSKKPRCPSRVVLQTGIDRRLSFEAPRRPDGWAARHEAFTPSTSSNAGASSIHAIEASGRRAAQAGGMPKGGTSNRRGVWKASGPAVSPPGRPAAGTFWLPGAGTAERFAGRLARGRQGRPPALPCPAVHAGPLAGSASAAPSNATAFRRLAAQIQGRPAVTASWRWNVDQPGR